MLFVFLVGFGKRHQFLSVSVSVECSNWRQRCAKAKVSKVQAGDSNNHAAHHADTDDGANPIISANEDRGTFTVDACVINPDFVSLVNITFEEVKAEAESFNRENWHKIVQAKTIRYLYWPENELLCRKYVEVDKNLMIKVYKKCTLVQ